MVAILIFFERLKKELFVTPFYLIFKKSLKDGKLPTTWKDVLVTALNKKGDKHLPSTYKSASLTSVICKMWEHIIKNHLLQYFMRNKFITSRQHGFCTGHSCETQLIHVLDDCTSDLNFIALLHLSQVAIFYSKI